jgi:protein-L-isoaspartate(D-aspartate) O-methyltransferase
MAEVPDLPDVTEAELRMKGLRLSMVAYQLERRGIRDPLVLDAMRRVARHLFVPASLRAESYEDMPLPIGEGQTISQPYMVALMTEAMLLTGGEKVLEVGTGSGYQAAILAEIGCKVHTMERNETLAAAAQRRLAGAGYADIEVHVGDGTLGLAEHAPFEAIVVTAGGPVIPAPLTAQLAADGGVLVIPVGTRGIQELMRVTRSGEEFRSEALGGCRFVPLVGECGW